jgi:hypothetical protein
MNTASNNEEINKNSKLSPLIAEIERRRGEYYTGFFSDNNGNPDFKGLGPILKGVLYLFLFIVLILENNYIFLVPLILFFIGKVMTAIRFFYVKPLEQNPNGEDIYFIRMNTLEQYVEGFIALFVVFYLLLNKVFSKKNK